MYQNKPKASVSAFVPVPSAASQRAISHGMNLLLICLFLLRQMEMPGNTGSSLLVKLEGNRSFVWRE